jgi:hypothetical protein
MSDDVLREIRTAREAYAQRHNFDVYAMVAELKSLDSNGDWQVLSHPPRTVRSSTTPLPVIALPETAPNPTLLRE